MVRIRGRFHIHIHVAFFSLALTCCSCLRRGIETDAAANTLVVDNDNASEQLVENTTALSFSPPEHQIIGDDAYRRFWQDVQLGEQYRELHENTDFWNALKKLLGYLVRTMPRQPGQLSFGDLVFLAGDFFSGKFGRNKLQIDPAGALLSIKRHLKKKAAKLLKYIDSMVANGLHIQPGFYSRNFWFGVYRGMKYAKLGQMNYNHFGGPHYKGQPRGGIAFQEYEQIHAAALGVAESGDILEALQLEGTAGHYLSDLFAAGHVRTPREELHRVCGNHGLATILSMHDEDGFLGLTVKSEKVEVPWRAYGDARYSLEENRANREHVAQALKTGILGVFHTFLNANAHMSENFTVDSVASHIPFATDESHPPLVTVWGGHLRGRVTPPSMRPGEYKIIQLKCRPFLKEKCISCEDFSKMALTARQLTTMTDASAQKARELARAQVGPAAFKALEKINQACF